MTPPGKGQSSDPERLLGGYASGSLSEQEQKELLEKALQDQSLFDELMGEQALKEVLDDPVHRRELLQTLQPPSAWRRLWNWIGTPGGLVAAGAAAAVVVAAVGLSLRQGEKPAALPEVAMRRERVEDLRKAPPAEPAPLIREQQTRPLETPPGSRAAPPRGPAREALSVPAPKAQPLAGAPAPMAADAVTAPSAAAEAGAPSPDSPAPVAYGILRDNGEGLFQPMDSAAALRDGDRFKVTVTPRQAGSLTVSRTPVNGPPVQVFSGSVPAEAALIFPTGSSFLASDTRTIVVELRTAPEQPGGPFGFGVQSPAARSRRDASRAAETEAKRSGAPSGFYRIEIPVRR